MILPKKYKLGFKIIKFQKQTELIELFYKLLSVFNFSKLIITTFKISQKFNILFLNFYKFL